MIGSYHSTNRDVLRDKQKLTNFNHESVMFRLKTMREDRCGDRDDSARSAADHSELNDDLARCDPDDAGPDYEHPAAMDQRSEPMLILSRAE